MPLVAFRPRPSSYSEALCYIARNGPLHPTLVVVARLALESFPSISKHHLSPSARDHSKAIRVCNDRSWKPADKAQNKLHTYTQIYIYIPIRLRSCPDLQLRAPKQHPPASGSGDRPHLKAAAGPPNPITCTPHSVTAAVHHRLHVSQRHAEGAGAAAAAAAAADDAHLAAAANHPRPGCPERKHGASLAFASTTGLCGCTGTRKPAACQQQQQQQRHHHHRRTSISKNKRRGAWSATRRRGGASVERQRRLERRAGGRAVGLGRRGGDGRGRR